MAYSGDDSCFSTLNEEIKAIERQFHLSTGMINLVREHNLDTLFLKIDKLIEIKVVLQCDYPKVPPNSLKVLYSKNENPALEETLEEFFRNSTLILNDIIDRCYGKCCILRIYKEMRRLVDGNKHITGVLSGAVKHPKAQDRIPQYIEQTHKIEEEPMVEVNPIVIATTVVKGVEKKDLYKQSPVGDLRYGEIKEWTVQSALAIIAPKNACGVIQNIRKNYDRTYDRWPPHINLLYPFAETLDLEKASDDLCKILVKHRAFNLSLNKLNHFADNCVVYLEPNLETAAAIAGIQRDLVAYFGQAANKSHTEFKSHMTVAQPEQRKDAGKNWSSKMMDKIKNEFDKDGISTQFRVNAVFWITRQGDEPFKVKHAFPLGRSGVIDYRAFNFF